MSLYPPPPRKQSWGGGVGITLSVRLSACLSVSSLPCPGCNSIPTCPIWIFHTIIVHDLRVCHEVISPRSRSQCTYKQNPCTGHNSSVPSWIWIIFHTIVVHDPRVCHNITFIQGHISKVKVKVHTYPKSVFGP